MTQHRRGRVAIAKGRPKEPEHAIGDVIDWTYSGNKLHPTQKPLPVLLPLVDTFSPKQGIVLDPFAGSGSTLQAAQSWAGHISASSWTRSVTPSRREDSVRPSGDCGKPVFEVSPVHQNQRDRTRRVHGVKSVESPTPTGCRRRKPARRDSCRRASSSIITDSELFRQP